MSKERKAKEVGEFDRVTRQLRLKDDAESTQVRERPRERGKGGEGEAQGEG